MSSRVASPPGVPGPTPPEPTPTGKTPARISRFKGATFPTGWARKRPARVLREVVQVAGLTPLVHAEVRVSVHGLAELQDVHGPAVIVANHCSHLDTALILCTLPRDRRRRTAVAAASDYFFQTWWKATGSTIAFNTYPLDRRGGGLSSTPHQLLADGWSILIYPEGTRSVDGFMGRFRLGAAMMAVENRVPVIPVGLRGTFAAMPRGRSWPVPGRPPVSVRYGAPIFPADGESLRQFAPRIAASVAALLAEDSTTWWQTKRGGAELEAADPPAPAPASWRRVWEQTKPPSEGGRPERPRIWR